MSENAAGAIEPAAPNAVEPNPRTIAATRTEINSFFTFHPP
jgi:hypothetical protein